MATSNTTHAVQLDIRAIDGIASDGKAIKIPEVKAVPVQQPDMAASSLFSDQRDTAAFPVPSSDQRTVVYELMRRHIHLADGLPPVLEADVAAAYNALPADNQTYLHGLLQGANGLVVEYSPTLSGALGCNANVSPLYAREAAIQVLWYVLVHCALGAAMNLRVLRSRACCPTFGCALLVWCCLTLHIRMRM